MGAETNVRANQVMEADIVMPTGRSLIRSLATFSVLATVMACLFLSAGCAKKDEAEEAYTGPGPSKAGAPAASMGGGKPAAGAPPPAAGGVQPMAAPQ